MRPLMLLAALAAATAGCSTNSHMLDPVHTAPIGVTPSHHREDTVREDPYENPTSRRVDALWP